MHPANDLTRLNKIAIQGTPPMEQTRKLLAYRESTQTILSEK